MADTEDPTLIEYENLIEQLMQENETLKKRIYDLEKENSLIKGKISKIEEKPSEFKENSHAKETITPTPITSTPVIVKKEDKKTIKLFKKPKKADVLEPWDAPEPLKEPELEILSDLETPVPTISSSNKPIVEGYSRRQCPHCDNNRHMFIHEEIDKTNIILAYPRIYGKKYKCGVCGTQWKVASE